MNKNDSVLEIGGEEIPASFLVGIPEQLKNLIIPELEAHHLSVGEIFAWSAPRRLVLYLKDLPEENSPRPQEIIGPALRVGVKDGKYTTAARGFAQRYGQKEEELKIKDTPKGKYLYLILNEKPVPTPKILTEIYPRLITRISFPKNMVWEETRFRFARPIRWFLALYDEQVLKFSLAGLNSGRFSRGLAPDYSLIKVASARAYLTTLKNHNIIVQNDERLTAIRDVLQDAQRTLPKFLKIKIEENLLSEINYLVECPTAVVGKFPEKYLHLPAEIIFTVLKSKQKFFAVTKKENEKTILSNFFVGIRNGPSLGQEQVREGYERVVSARLEDAEFYFQQDRKTSLISKTQKLSEIALPSAMGTLFEHIQRTKAAANWLNQRLTRKISEEKINRAIDLIKADISTGLVGEYPELQGIAGRIYSRLDGETEEIGKVIEQHYWPLTATSQLPENEFCSLIALADKVETVVGYYLSGIRVSGSEDPYGLRRLSTGILRIIRQQKWLFSFQELLDFVSGQFSVRPEQAITELKEFFVNRLEQLFLNEKYRFDTIRATIAVRPLEIVDCEQRIIALEEIRKSPDWENIEVGFKRANNILRQAGYTAVVKPNPELFATDAEKELFQVIQKIQQESQRTTDYFDFWKKFLSCRPTIDKFFNDVLVMAERENVRQNRLALLRNLTILTENIADLTRLGKKL